MPSGAECNINKTGENVLTDGNYSTLPDGAQYSGELSEVGLPSGQGKAVWPDGRTYEGSFKKGLMDGYGILICPEIYRYEGELKEGKMHGYGRITYINNLQYVGYWKDGVYHGQGTMIFPAGTAEPAEGLWVDGHFQG